MAWVIFNASGYRWGSDVFLSEDDAKSDLAGFYKGIKVDLSRFYVVNVPDDEANNVRVLPGLQLAGNA